MAVELFAKSWVCCAVLSPEGVREDLSLSREVFTARVQLRTTVTYKL